MSEVRYEWQKVYEEALGEFEPQELISRVHACETAFLERLQELRISSDGHVERQAIAVALHGLLGLKTTRLKYPT